MAEEGKKISFGFNKPKKQSNFVKVSETNKSDIEYVDSFDGMQGKFSYKGNIRCDEPVKKELVIPLIGTKTVLEVIQSRLESKNFQGSEDNDEKNDKAEIKDEEKTELIKKDDFKSPNLSEENKPLSIDDLAAKEILNDLENNLKIEKSSKTLVIKQSHKVSKSAEELDIDYENIPVSDFGLAMLRGMGWTPETGIGKDQKVVQVVAPKLRPKGLGLGADKVMEKKKAPEDPDLTISIKGYVKFVSGKYKGHYGQVEAMDDETGRVTVNLALGGIISTSEVFLMPITKKDYEKNSKVINPVKYEDFMDKTGSESETKGKKDVERGSSPRGRKEDKKNSHRKERYDRGRERNRATERKERERDSTARKRFHSSESQSPERSKHKKSKKSSREGSENRRHKKSKKKEKKKRKSDYDTEDDSDERRYKKEKSSHHYHHSKSKRR